MIVTRFAPSPTGFLHLGHAYSAAFAWQKARHGGGKFLLRIEDIDPTRCRDEYITAIEEDLAWLGLAWERPVRLQSRHFGDYQAALDKLRGKNLLYPCFCSRKDIMAEIADSGHAPHPASQGPEGVVYPGICRHLSSAERERRMESGMPYCWRLDMERAMKSVGELNWLDEGRGAMAANPQDFGDIVLARKETPASYHLAVTVDDALQGVTCVTRGEDLLRATDVHRLLQALLELPAPFYHHHRLLTDVAGRRYAKRDKAMTLRALRENGASPSEVMNMVGGWPVFG
ncbi:MAG: tRNA glutamyl-Q(34) synthetase GluQRS [Alphaproteobacteria bacterium]